VEELFCKRQASADTRLQDLDDIAGLASTINDVYGMLSRKDFPDATARLFALTTAASVNRLHDKMIAKKDQTDQYRDDPLFKEEFDPPPLKENGHIIPIQTYKDLCEESLIMHHCVRTYCRRIWEKKYYVYRVLAPERATLGIRIAMNGNWEIDAIKLICNSSPSEETRVTVWEWFEKEAGSNPGGCSPK
jgi:hypothetical protein